MAFINSWFFWALLALIIPIIIHLFHFRRYKKVLFTNVRFLKELKEEQNSQRKLRNLLVLAARLLALIFLILGFVQPFLTDNTQIDLGNKNIGLFIDNSQSMASLSEDIPLLDVAKANAREIVSSYSEQDHFQILSHDFEGRHQRLLSKEDAIAMIDEIQISPKAQKLSAVLNRHKQILRESNRNQTVYLISDFQKSINDLESYQDTSMQIKLLSMQSVEEKNVSIDTAWLESKVPMINQSNKLVLKITNHSNELAESVPLSIVHKGQKKPVGSLNIQAQSTITDTIDIAINATGWQKIELSVSDFPITFDNSYYISFNVSDKVKVLSINENGGNKYLKSVYEGLPYHELSNVSASRIDYASFVKYDLIILNDLKNLSSGLATELDNYIINGGNVLCFLSKNIDKIKYNSFLNRLAADEIIQSEAIEKEVANINEEEFIFKEVFESSSPNRKLPKVRSSQKMTRYQNRQRDMLLTHRDGSPYLLKYTRRDGNLYVCTSGLDLKENDLVVHSEIFVPMLYKMSISAHTADDMAYTIGKNNVVSVASQLDGDNISYIIKGEEEFIPGQSRNNNRTQLDINNQIKKSGYYDIILADDIIKTIAFNYDRVESDLSTTRIKDLAYENPKIKLINDNQKINLAQVISEQDRGKQLWRWCLILALIFLGIETLLLRFWKA